MSTSENSVTWKIRVEPAFEKVEMPPEIFGKKFFMLILFEVFELSKELAGRIPENLVPKLLYHLVLSLTFTTPQARPFLHDTFGFEK